jgi:isocitrate lyase
MELKIKELEIGDMIGSPGFEERVQTSMKCKNNDFIMNQIDTLKKKIEYNKIANRRVDNALRRLEQPSRPQTERIEKEDRDVIIKIFIEKKSISRTAQELYRTRKSIRKAIERGLNKIEMI